MNACFDGLGIEIGGTSFDESPGAGPATTVKGTDAAGVTAVVTTTLPAPTTAVAGTVAVIEVALFRVTAAVAPPIVTVAFVRPEPLMVTTLPTAPEAGETALMVGGGGARTVKADVAAVKPVTVTTTFPGPTVAKAGTVAVIVFPLMEKVAAAPPMVTVAPLNPVPLMVTTEPADPEAGDTELIAGAVGGGGAKTVKAAETGLKPATVTVRFPAPGVAEAGTLVLICVPLLLIDAAVATPPMVTLAPARFAPLMVTASFGKPLATERLEILGGWATGPPAHPAVLILIVPAPKVTVAVEHAEPLTVTVCAWLTLPAKPKIANDAAMSPRVREVMFMKFL